VTMNADCIARSPVVTLQGHPALRSTIDKKLATIIIHSFKRPIQERQQDTTIHSNTTSNLNHLQGEVHQPQEQLDRGDSEASRTNLVVSRPQKQFVTMCFTMRKPVSFKPV